MLLCLRAPLDKLAGVLTTHADKKRKPNIDKEAFVFHWHTGVRLEVDKLIDGLLEVEALRNEIRALANAVLFQTMFTLEFIEQSLSQGQKVLIGGGLCFMKASCFQISIDLIQGR